MQTTTAIIKNTPTSLIYELRDASGGLLATVELWTFTSSGVEGVQGQLRSASGTVLDLAQQLGGDHFNWYQVAMEDSRPVYSACGVKLQAPYVDPPPGGYPPSIQGGDDAVWSDKVPWYLDEHPPPEGYGSSRSTWRSQLQEQDTVLLFQDDPAFSQPFRLRFRTWLVLVGADSQPIGWFGGFRWTSLSQGGGEGQVRLLGPITVPPADAEYDALVHAEGVGLAWFWLPRMP